MADRVGSGRLAEAEVYKGLKIYVITLVALTVVAWSFVGIRAFHMRDVHPLGYIFPSGVAPFTDFTSPSERLSHFGEPNLLSRTDLHYKFPYPYPVPSIYAYLFFLRVFHHPIAAYLIFAVLSFFIPICFLSLRVKRMGAGWVTQVELWFTFLFGFPLLFLLERGNIEAVIWLFILMGMVAYTRNHLITSAVLWAIAASMKITPGLLFLLFLTKRKYSIFALAVAATVTFSLLALARVGPTIRQAASDNAKAEPFIVNEFILVRGGQFDVSLFGGTKQVIALYDFEHKTDRSKHLPQISPGSREALQLYNIVVPLGALLLYWFRLRHLPLLNQCIAYIVLSILLPQVSYEYKLVQMYLAWGAFLLFLLTDVATDRVKISAKSIHTVLLSCAVIFVPLPYLVLANNGQNYSFAAQVKMVFLLLILLTVLRVPMPSSLFGDLRTLPSDSQPEPDLN